MKMNPSQRMEWLDRAKAIGIFLVVIGHISGIPTLSVNFIYAFHMPLFFFLSGYLYKNNRKSILNRFVILLFSYAIASFIYTISWNLFVNKNNIDWAAEIQRIIYCCYSDRNPCSVLWFIQCLAVVTLLYGIIDSVLGKYGNARFFIITTSFWLIGYYFEINNITLPFRIQTAAVALPFYCIGNYCRKNQTIYKIKENKNIKISLLVIAFLGYITSVLMNGRVDMESGVYKYYILFVIGAICGIVLVLFAANAMNRRGALHYRQTHLNYLFGACLCGYDV